MLKAWLAWLGVNRAVFYGTLSKLILALSGLVTLVLVAARFTPDLQGYYFTFGSIAALQVLAELGMGTVVIQFSSHLWSRLSLRPDGAIEGDPEALSRFRSLARLTTAWHGIGGIVVAAGLGAGGYLFFAGTPRGDVDWRGAWLAMAALTGAKMGVLPFWALIEGSNQVVAAYRYRAWSAGVGALAVWGGIVAGGGLWAMPAGAAAEVAVALFFLAYRHAAFLRSLAARPEGPRIPWRGEILPLQARIAVSWACGFFIFSLFPPVLFRYHGAAAAGQWGMTWSALAAVSSIAGLWITARVPQFGIWIARGEYEALDREHRRVTRLSVALTVLGAAAVAAAVVLLQGMSLAARLLAPLPTALLACATAAMQVSNAQSAYLRAHRREPFLSVAVAQASLTTAAVFGLGIPFGALGMSAGYLGVVLLVVLPLGTWIWIRCRAAWRVTKDARQDS